MNFENVTVNSSRIHEMHENFKGLEPVITESKLYQYAEQVPELKSLVNSLIGYAERYADDVWLMHEMLINSTLDTEEGVEEYANMDTARTRLHDALIDSIAILSRALVKNGLDNEWVRELTDGVNLNRAACGSFALVLVYHRYLDNIGKVS
jgi:hypothetical protein